MCVYVCLYVSQFNSPRCPTDPLRLRLRWGLVIRAGLWRCTVCQCESLGESIIVTLNSLSITHIMARGEWLINTFYCTSRLNISLTSSVILRIDGLIIPSASLREIGFISYFLLQTLFLLWVLLVKCKYHNVACDLPAPTFCELSGWDSFADRPTPSNVESDDLWML